MPDRPPPDPADHAEDFAHRWAERLDEYCTIRMAELGIPDEKNGEPDPYHPRSWRAFVPDERTGGYASRGITVNSGVLNPDLLAGKKGGRVWAKARLKDRIDAIVAHEWAEDQARDHGEALKAAARTTLPVTDGARRILRAMAR